MDFALSPSQIEMKDRIVAFCRERLGRSAHETDEGAAFGYEEWRACAEEGIQGLPIPRHCGGSGQDPLTAVVALEALGYACTDQGLLFALGAHIWAVQMPILRFGTQEQKTLWLPALCDGSAIGAFASAEPNAGSDAFNLRTTATPSDGGYVLNGSKIFISNAPIADVALVLARAPGSRGGSGVTAFLVPREIRGFSTRTIETIGLRSSQMGEITLEECYVPADARLGAEGAGVSVFTEAMTWERSFILAPAVGAMQRQLEGAAAFVKRQRRERGRLGSTEEVGDKLVDMRMRIECARLLLYQLAWMKSQERSVLLESSMVKLFLSEAWYATSVDAVQVRGAHGYLKESEAERDLRDAIASRIYSGTSEIQRMIIAQSLVL